MRKLNRTPKFSLLAIVLVLALLMSSSFAFAQTEEENERDVITNNSIVSQSVYGSLTICKNVIPEDYQNIPSSGYEIQLYYLGNDRQPVNSFDGMVKAGKCITFNDLPYGEYEVEECFGEGSDLPNIVSWSGDVLNRAIYSHPYTTISINAENPNPKITVTNEYFYNVIVKKEVKGNKAPSNPSFAVCFERLDTYEGKRVINPFVDPCGLSITEGNNYFFIAPGEYKVSESCDKEPKTKTISPEELSIGEMPQTVTITNDYGNKKRRGGGGGGQIVEEFPTPPPPSEPIIVTTPEPAAPVEVVEVPVEPAPELPNTGAPIAAGLGLLLAAGGLALTRMKK